MLLLALEGRAWIELAALIPSLPLLAGTPHSDGIVSWRSCLEEGGPRRENVVVESSHCGMGHHAAALAVIADRLAQREGTWRPFTSWGVGPWRAERLTTR
jgi:hypothetical protein